MELQKVQRTTLTMKEAAEYLGISYWLINQLVRQKQIPCSKVGGKYLFRVQVLDEYLIKKSKIQLVINSKVRRGGDMYDIQWFKVESNIFSNRKIQIILKLPYGDTYFRVWIQLIALAVECNNEGRLEIGENNPMTIQNFSKIMGKSYKKIEKILNKFVELEMLIKEGETFLIKNWNVYQSIDKCEKIREQGRERQRKHREKLKSESEKSNVTVTLGNAEEEKKIEEITKEDSKEENRGKEDKNGFREYSFN